METPPTKFWMLWRENRGQVLNVYQTKGEAIADAERLVKLNGVGELTVYLLEAVEFCVLEVKTSVEWHPTPSSFPLGSEVPFWTQETLA